MIQPQPIYKYIQGKEILSQEHMLSASEIAECYCIYTINGKPYSAMIAAILRNFVFNNNLNINEYYYPHSHGVMQVYPRILWEKALEDFMFHQKLYQYADDKKVKLTYEINNTNEKKGFRYRYIPKNKIIDIFERRKQNGNL